MDANETKTLKHFGGDNARNVNKDMFSRLPEEILVHILRFLPTKESVKTSILSKRWRYLWVLDRNFTFYDASRDWTKNKTDDQALDIRASYLGSIERALVHRNAHCLRSVFIYINMHVSASRLSSWLSAAVEHKVQILQLDLLKQKEFELPNSFCASKSLRTFSMQLHSVLKVPSFICFSSLDRLFLTGVVFPDDQTTQNLFSGCPVLGELTLTNCRWENLRETTIEIPSLRSFTFDVTSSLIGDHFLGCKIKISAKNLKSLDVNCYLTVELLPSNLPCLDYASIDIHGSNGGLERGLSIVQLLSGLQNVKTLVLSRGALEPLLYNENLPALLPTFYNLNLFALHWCPIGNAYASRALVYILEKSPNLETLSLSRGFEPGEEYMMLETVPDCFLSCLKCFRISDFDGDEEDVSVLKHVYKNAPFLNRLAMDCMPEMTEDLQRQEEILQELRQVREGSDSCSIEFIPYDDPSKWQLSLQYQV